MAILLRTASRVASPFFSLPAALQNSGPVPLAAVVATAVLLESAEAAGQAWHAGHTGHDVVHEASGPRVAYAAIAPASAPMTRAGTRGRGVRMWRNKNLDGRTQFPHRLSPGSLAPFHLDEEQP